MTIEITRQKSIYTYRISPEDPRNIDRRENKFNARWFWYLRRDTPREAQLALLKLDKGDATEDAVQA